MILRKNSVYFIMGSQNTNRDPYEILKQSIEAGIDMFQYREKGIDSLNDEEKLQLGGRLRNLCKQKSIPFIVNDDVELALALEADGIHIGQDDLPIEKVKQLTNNRLIIGLSTSTVEEAIQAERDGADYIGVGPIFSTSTKEDAKQPIGLCTLRSVRKHVQIPIVAIGGISSDTACDLFDAGATAVATISAIINSTDIKETVERMKGQKRGN